MFLQNSFDNVKSLFFFISDFTIQGRDTLPTNGHNQIQGI